MEDLAIHAVLTTQHTTSTSSPEESALMGRAGFWVREPCHNLPAHWTVEPGAQPTPVLHNL